MARVVIPAKTKKLVSSGLTKLVADMDTLTVKNPAAIAAFRSELASAAQLLTGLSASLESLANQPTQSSVSESTSQASVSVNGKTVASSEQTTKVRRQQPAPAKQPEPTPVTDVNVQSNEPSNTSQVSKIPTGRGRKKAAVEQQPEVQPEQPTASEPNGLLATKGHKRIRKPKK